MHKSFLFYIFVHHLKNSHMKSNFLQHLYKGKEYSTEINWDFIEAIPELARLKECQQNPKWHSEGDAWTHTRLAYEKLEKDVFTDFNLWYSLNDIEIKVIRAAVILHDIGKGVTTSLGKDGNWHSYGHEVEGEKIARVLLWDEDLHLRELICSLIRYHMEPLRLFESKNWLTKLLEISTRVPIKYLYCVKMADLLGSVQINGGTMDEDIMKLELIKETAITLNIWDLPGTEDHRKIVKYSSNRNILPWKITNEKKVAYILIGLPGAGKNTWIEKNLSMVDNLANISRDDIRVELGYCKPDEKYLGTDEEERTVTKVYDEKMAYALQNCKCIVLNNVHLKKKYREISVNQLRSAGFEVIYVYIEAPTLEFNYKRRDGQIKEDRIKAMALSYEWPEPTEYDKLIIEKQTW